jgi:peptidoglycan hydrolase FlgJ
MTAQANPSLAIDAKALGQLKLQASKTPDKALKAAAQQFEALFMNMMLKSMRDATPQDGAMDNEQTRMFTGMLDQQLAQNMSSGRGIGLADMLVKQLSQSNQASALSSALSHQPPVLDPRSSLLSPQSSVINPGSSAVPSAYNANTQQNFFNQMLPHALKASNASGVPPELMLGQAALESGWGHRQILMPDGTSSHNLFGIKAGANWHGKVAEVMTTEYRNGVAYKQLEKFRAYDSFGEAFKDYARMMSGNPRYAGVMQQSGNPAGMAQALQSAGYATDPKYAEKLVSVMRKMNIAG